MSGPPATDQAPPAAADPSSYPTDPTARARGETIKADATIVDEKADEEEGPLKPPFVAEESAAAAENDVKTKFETKSRPEKPNEDIENSTREAVANGKHQAAEDASISETNTVVQDRFPTAEAPHSTAKTDDKLSVQRSQKKAKEAEHVTEEKTEEAEPCTVFTDRDLKQSDSKEEMSNVPASPDSKTNELAMNIEREISPGPPKAEESKRKSEEHYKGPPKASTQSDRQEAEKEDRASATDGATTAQAGSMVEYVEMAVTMKPDEQLSPESKSSYAATADRTPVGAPPPEIREEERPTDSAGKETGTDDKPPPMAEEPPSASIEEESFKPPPPPTFMVEEIEEYRYGFPDTFEREKRRKKACQLKMTSKRLKISLGNVVSNDKDSTTAMDLTSPTKAPSNPELASSSMLAPVSSCSTEVHMPGQVKSLNFVSSTAHLEEDRCQLERELEDSLFFFQETHEEQDPKFIAFVKEREEAILKVKLAELEQEDAVGRQEIDNNISAQSREKQMQMTRNIEKYREKVEQEQKKDVQKLMKVYHDKQNEHKARINEVMRQVQERHQKDLQKAATQHRQQFQGPQALNSPQAAQRWAAVNAQLQHKHQLQAAEFRKKSAVAIAKTDEDFRKSQERIKETYTKKLHEVEGSRRKVCSRMFNQYSQVRQRYLKLHSKKIAKKKDTLIKSAQSQKANRGDSSPILLEDNTEPGGNSKKPNNELQLDDDKDEFRPPSPLKSTLTWIAEERPDDPQTSGAAARHKQRKSVLQSIEKKLLVEIHNEGLWISIFSDKHKEGDENASKAEDTSSRSNTTRGSNKGSGKAESSKCADEKPSDDKVRDASDTAQERFFPWGVDSQTILQSIVCGELPRGYHFLDNGNDFVGALTVQGGHVRCVVTDLRTNENTASQQRAESVKDAEEVNLKGLEQKIVQLSQLARDAEAKVANAEVEEKGLKAKVDKTAGALEKAKRVQLEFRTKFAGYLGPDGNPLPTTSVNDRKELTNAIVRYKTMLDDASQKHHDARVEYNECNVRSKKMQAIARHAQKAVALATNSLKKKKSVLDPKRGRRQAQHEERAAERVRNVIGAFKKTAEKRREQLNQKRNSSASSTWVQSLPGLPGPLKKSLWHKMHRRRQQIVLRPSLESLTSELRDTVTRAIRAAHDEKKPQVDLEVELLRAEQLFCLAVHPAAPKEKTPSVPPPSGSSSENWGEPGWQLVLNVSQDNKPQHILPCAPSFPVFSNNHAELCSAPGRQAASFTSTSHLRCLSSNLSAVATATSLAETNPSVSSTVTLLEADPLNVSEETLKIGYGFHMNPIPKPTPKRKYSNASSQKESAAKAVAEVAQSKQASDHAASVVAAEQTSVLAEKTGKAAQKKRRTSRTTVPNPSPRARKTKADTKRASVTQNLPPLARTASSAATHAAPHAASQYSHHRPTTPAAAAAAAAAAAQYGQQYMKSQSQQQQQQHTYQQQMQQRQQQQRQQQQQQACQPQGQFGSPQQRQMAQIRMMQQQSVQSRGGLPPGYPQRPPQQFFNPMAAAPGAPQAYQPQLAYQQQMPQMGHAPQLQQQQQQRNQQARSPKGAGR